MSHTEPTYVPSSLPPRTRIEAFFSELRPTLRLSIPLIVAELGWMAMGIVDTMMVGRLPNSAVAIGAVSLGGGLYYTIAIFGSGLLLGLDTMVAQAFGRKDLADARTSLVNSLILALILALLYFNKRKQLGLFEPGVRIELRRMWDLLKLGFPAATQILLEIGVFTIATAFAAKLGPFPLAGHQIALNAAAFTYMVPLGISSAAAVRVGQAIGRRDPAGARRAGWTAIVVGAAFMSFAAILFVTIPTWIARIFSPDPRVIHIGATLLLVAAAFELFDGLQTVATGALRGLGDTHTPMLTNLISYWVIGLPLGYMLCFHFGWGAVGLWIGLCIGLILIGSILLFVWNQRTRQLSRAN